MSIFNNVLCACSHVIAWEKCKSKSPFISQLKRDAFRVPLIKTLIWCSLASAFPLQTFASKHESIVGLCCCEQAKKAKAFNGDASDCKLHYVHNIASESLLVCGLGTRCLRRKSNDKKSARRKKNRFEVLLSLRSFTWVATALHRWHNLRGYLPMLLQLFLICCIPLTR